MLHEGEPRHLGARPRPRAHPSTRQLHASGKSTLLSVGLVHEVDHHLMRGVQGAVGGVSLVDLEPHDRGGVVARAQREHLA